jgi:hypothetical protein
VKIKKNPILTAIPDPPTSTSSELHPEIRERYDNASPTQNLGSATSEGKKKHGLTLNNVFRGSSKALPQTPLPPMTPVKAAKLLGVNPEIGFAEGSRAAQHERAGFDGVNDEQIYARAGWPQKQSAPVLSTPDHVVTSRFREQDTDTDRPKPKSFWKSSKNTARKMSEHFHCLVPHKSEPPRNAVPDVSGMNFETLMTDFVYRIGVDQPNYPLQDPPEVVVHPAPTASSRRRRMQKGQKELDRMTPITEVSYDDMRTAHRNGEDNSELDVISEYAHDDQSYNRLTYPQRTGSLDPTFTNSFELSKDEISPTDDDFEQGNTAEEEEEEEHIEYPGAPTDLSQLNRQQNAVVQLRSPLQAVENCLLDVVEMELEAERCTKAKEEESPEEDDYSVHGTPVELSKAKQPIHPAELELLELKKEMEERDARKALIDKDVTALKQSHEKMKEEFAAMKFCGHCGHDAESGDSGSDDDLPSIRSSIDLDEEPTVHTAIAMPILRVTPGMVKLIDIPPRRQSKSCTSSESVLSSKDDAMIH